MKKYKTILIDPPWEIKFDLPWGQGKKEQYKCMTLDEIRLLPMRELADDEGCDLFLWTTQTYLPDALELMEAWGFKYHVTITWDKGGGLVQFGWHRRTELCLYGYSGKLGFEKRGQAVNTIIKDIPELFEERSGVHSRKPIGFIRAITAKTKEPRLEMFARANRAGWDAYGNEVANSILLPQTKVMTT